jgi:IS1 family transposase/transposase-like protein
MASNPLFYQLILIALMLICLLVHVALADNPPREPKTPLDPKLHPRRHSKEPKPFTGLIHQPLCEACEQGTDTRPKAPGLPPPVITFTRGRKRSVDTQAHCCPDPDCSYYGRLGLGNLRANGHPGGGPWRQFHCTACNGYFLETHGTLFHGKRVPVELLVRVLACLAEGLGIRATARVFEVDPNTVLGWLVEAAAQLQAFSAYFLCDVHVNQLQLDELYAVLREVKAGELSDAEGIRRLERSPYWVWTAMDPESKLLLVMDVGMRTLEMAQRVVHQVVQVLAPGCVPLVLTDGLKDYGTALLAHFGEWRQPLRRQDNGPMPKPRWIPLPQLLYAQVVKSYRRRRLVGVKYRVVFGTFERVQRVLSVCGRKINTAYVERLNLEIRQRVAAVGRRVNTLCQSEDGVRQQLAVFHAYYNFVLPHASLRVPLAVPVATRGNGSAKRWRPCTPAMAAGLTDRVWSLREVLLFRVPPWPRRQSV